jgi:hypothetical protein
MTAPPARRARRVVRGPRAGRLPAVLVARRIRDATDVRVAARPETERPETERPEIDLIADVLTADGTPIAARNAR